MKKLISALLAVVMLLSLTMSAVALTPEEKLENIEAISDFMKNYGIEVKGEDDPFWDIFKIMLQDDNFYNQFMNAMVSQYDNYSLFVPAGNYDTVYPTTNSYVGIGVTMEQYGESVRIAAVTEGGPAAEAGFLAGDLIYSVDRVDLSKATMEQVGEKIRGEKDTQVTVTVKRTVDGKVNLITRTLTRRYIGVPNFTSEVLEDGIFYMDFNRFADVKTYVDFVFSIKDMVESNSRALILDLRGNPGGEVDMALNILNRLIPDETTYFMTRSKIMGEYDYDFYDSEGIGPLLNKIIILHDGGSASASEIIIASLHDLGYAETVGTQTYGKARGQYHVGLLDGSVAVVTGIELMAPTSPDYDGIGIAPDHVVSMGKSLDENGVEVIVDTQMQKALELAREYAKQPQQYTVDEHGNFTNNEKPKTEQPETPKTEENQD